MNWLLDLGNSRLKVAPWDPAGGLGAVQAWAQSPATVCREDPLLTSRSGASAIRRVHDRHKA